jgi:hypothetical protein
MCELRVECRERPFGASAATPIFEVWYPYFEEIYLRQLNHRARASVQLWFVCVSTIGSIID